MMNLDDSNSKYTVIEHKYSMLPVEINQKIDINLDSAINELQKQWKLKYPEYYTDYLAGQMLGKDNTKANISNLLFILFNKMDETFVNAVESNKELSIDAKKIINTLYTNQKEALKRILSIYGDDKIGVDLKKYVAFLSGYIPELVKLIK